MKNSGECASNLDKLLFWRERLGVHHDQFRVVGLAQVLDQSKAKARQPILVSNEHTLHFSCHNGIHQSQKPFTLNIETPPICIIQSSTTNCLETA